MVILMNMPMPILMSRDPENNLLSLLHISSPALPVGAFAYSQGLEYALDAMWCKDAAQIEEWLESTLQYGLGMLDLPVYKRMYGAWQKKDFDSVRRLNQELLCFRESKELYLEDVQVGSAYVQWHLGQDENRQVWLNELIDPTVVSMSALAAVLVDIPLNMAIQGFVWSWCENQVTCACKALPLGQTQAQQILQRLIPKMQLAIDGAMAIEDDDIGSGLFGLAMASSLHEFQYSRLFRS